MVNRPSPARVLGSAALLAVLLVGAPIALLTFAGNPLPATTPSWDGVVQALSRPDDGSVFVQILTWVAWAAWAVFSAAVAAEVPAQLAGRTVPRVPGLGGFQGGARWLVAPLIAAASLTGTAATAAENPTHQTVAGDSLWGVAQEHLDDGTRWEEIYELNKDQVGQDPNLVLQGQTLTLPADADTPEENTNSAPAAPTSADTSAPAPTDPTDQSRDLGPVDPDATDTVAPWTLDPDAPPTTQPDTDSADATGGVGRAADTGEATQGGQALAGGRAVAPVDQRTVASESPAPTAGETDNEAGVLSERSTLGLGALSAAGVLTLLAGARAMQRRRRRPGERIALPDQESTLQAEENLTQDADALMVQDLDRALRTLSRACSDAGQDLPGLRGARLGTDHIELFLTDEHTRLPAPFEDVDDAPGVVVVAREGLDGLLDAQAAQNIPAPYPALVTLGADADQAWVMLNLEEIGSLGLDGPARECRAVMAAAALELVSSTWADDLRVTLVGSLRELAVALGNDRVDYASSVSEIIAAARYTATVHSKALVGAGLETVTTARGAGLADSTWTPHLILLGSEPTEDERSELAELISTTPRVAVATITTRIEPMSPWVMEVGSDSTSTLHPIGMQLAAQRVHPGQYDDVIELLRTAQSPATPGPQWTQTLTDVTEPIPVSSTQATVTHLHHGGDPADLPDLALDEDPGPGDASAGATALALNDLTVTQNPQDQVEDPVDDAGQTPVAEDTQTAETGETPAAQEQLDQEDPSAEATHPVDVAVEETDPTPVDTDGGGQVVPFTPRGPVLRLLGPVTLEGAQGKAPSAPGRITEVLALLALHPAKDSTELDAALWPAKPPAASTRNVTMSKTRSWLGTTQDGTPLVPHVDEGGYRLSEEVTVDWHQMLALTGEDISGATTGELTQALGLVTGPPLSGVNPKKYVWAVADREEMIATISDIAHELATRHTRAGKATQALDATAIGLSADPTNEALWRARLQAAAAAGELDSCTEEMTQALDTMEGDLDPETITLLEDLHNPTHQAHA